jgi:hypothetical protein
MVADYPDQRAPGLSPLRHVVRSRGVGLVRHPQVAAEHVDAQLPPVLPVVGQLGHRVHPGDLDHAVGSAELVGRLAEPIGVQPRVLAVLGEFADALLTVGNGQRHHGTYAADHGEDHLHAVEAFAGGQRTWR